MLENEMAGWHHRMNTNLDKFRKVVRDREAWHAAVHEDTTGRLNDHKQRGQLNAT